jgi:hypothetical protein
MKFIKSIVKIICGIAPLYLMFAASSTATAQSFKLIATSDDPGPNLKIVLAWPEAPGVFGFNLYRKNQGDHSYPKTPVNVMPIKRVTQCVDIKHILGVGSAEWTLIQNALADSAGIFDPCKIGSLKPATDKRKYDMLMLLARGDYKIAMVMGLAFEDKPVTNGQKYAYKIEGINGAGNFVAVLDSNVLVTAGLFVSPPAPGGVVAEAADSKVQIRWDKVSDVTGFMIYRSTSLTGTFIQVNSSKYTTKITNKLNGDTLVPNPYGFLDYQRYDSSGMPAKHLVNVDSIKGPSNNVTYYYKVAATDLLGRIGTFSKVVSAKPKDMTPPKVPSDLLVTPDEIHSSFNLQWQRVKLDINGHIENGVITYSLYRYESAAKPDSGAVPVRSGIKPHPNPDIWMVSTKDTTPGLRVDYVDKVWYYRVVAMDAANHSSAYSVAMSGILKDKTRPALVQNITTKGGDASIFLSWQPNTEPDIQGYMIYRGYCDFGRWAECPKQKEEVAINNQSCNDDFIYLGQVDQQTVIKAVSSGKWAFEDKTVPPGSPLCYAYWIKAVDKSGNISGSYPKPISPEEIATIVCQRLRDRTPPEPAIISGLSARDNAVFVEWIGPPTQDIHSYYVYRATKDDLASYKFMAQVTAAIPPKTPEVIYGKYVPSITAGCDSVPYAINEYMSAGSFLDTKADPKTIYWYKVTGVDQNANESDISKAVGVSTFTFTTALASAPIITSIDVNTSPCGLLLKWHPAFNSTQHQGFVIFKSTSATGTYYQIPEVIKGNLFVDTNVAKGIEYWYRIAILDAKGILSQLSTPKSGKINP